MIDLLLEPLTYQYMVRAVWVSAMVGGVCAFLSAYLMLKGWSLMGDALAHSVVPGVALAYLLALPYSIGAFFAGLLASLCMAIVKKQTRLREDTTIGIIFTSFFAVGLLLISMNPTSVNVQAIILGNIHAITDSDVTQVVIISIVCLTILSLKWKDLLAIFFDENHARSIGLSVTFYHILFFTLLSAACVAALQTVGACLVIAMVITPGATAYLLTDRFGVLIIISVLVGTVSSGVGAYLSFHIDANTGGLIVTLQTVIFLLVFFFAPRYGYLKRRMVTNG
ncbi:MAG: hypothetical protein CSB48_09375 [Proteobacteria bacterium]|nr:MAG: hypothetical protein CSB48_09375 [Pseudomonadota bacterium]